MRARVSRAARQGVQHQGYEKGDGHKLVAEEEPSEAVQPPANKRSILQAMSVMRLVAYELLTWTKHFAKWSYACVNVECYHTQPCVQLNIHRKVTQW